MQCSSTSGQLPAVDLEHMKLRDAKLLNRLIARLKRHYQGTGQITIPVSGGKIDIDGIKLYRTLPADE